MPRLGPVSFAGPAVQAALSGYSDLPMRVVARAHGAPYCINEVVLDTTVVQRGKLQRLILDVPADDHPVGGQLMGSTPEKFGEAARLLVGAGYDVVDINFGCPVPRALGRRRGGFLLGDPGTALEIVDRVLDAVAGDAPVTVKMRRAIDDSADAERDFFTILDGAFERGISGVTVHGRTVEQRYVGPSRWAFLARVKRHVGERSVWGSGDVFRPQDVLDMVDQTGVDAVTVARGCIGNPWIFTQVADLLGGREPQPPTVGEQRTAIELHREASCAYYKNDVIALRRLRTHAIKYAGVHPEPKVVRDAFVRLRTFADLDAVFERHYGAGDHGRVSAELAAGNLDAQRLKSCAPSGGEVGGGS